MYKDKEKAKVYRLRHYYKNQDQYKFRRRRRKKEIRDYIENLKSTTSCMDCNEFYPFYVMHFDHRPGERKVFNLAEAAAKGLGQESLENEIKKCDIVCANCHAERTFQRQQNLVSVTEAPLIPNQLDCVQFVDKMPI